MSEARIGRISNENSTAGPIISGITTFSGQNYFVPPKGTTAERPSNCPVGSIRFNTDSAKLEYFDGLQWLEMEAFNNELGGGTGSNTGLGNRGITAGGYVAPARSNIIDYITISTLGDAQDFGDLTVARSGSGSCSSSTRGLFGLGYTPTGQVNTIDYVTISSTGNAVSFGIATSVSEVRSGCSNSTRGLFAGGYISSPTSSNIIEYVTIASTGNAVDFGDLTLSRPGVGSFASSTRGVFGGGYTPNTNVIDFVTITTTGNAIDFGDLTVSRGGIGGCSNATRGLFAAGQITSPSSFFNVIDYVTISTVGNALDFGDLTIANRSEWSGGMSSSTRAVWAGGHSGGGTQQNSIEFVTIQTTGNAQDFGDLTVGRRGPVSLSNGHGGL